jgi:uncharacterized protein YnzC (UPF0291/DUF896 family)
MEMENLIKRINELAHKQKGEGLNLKEQQEQKELREMYLSIFRSNFKNQLDHTKIKTPDGKLHPLKHQARGHKK